MGLNAPAMVTSPTGKGVILMGGRSKDCWNSKAMFELTESMKWNPVKQNLQNDHYRLLVIPIPDELVYEKATNNKQKRRKLQ